MYDFQTDIDDLKRQNGILDQQGMALVFEKVIYLIVNKFEVNLQYVYIHTFIACAQGAFHSLSWPVL